MTDPRNASPGSYWTSVRSNRPGAASPAGWFPPPAGEAAPPVRLREPARSDAQCPHDTKSPCDVETRPTAMYRVPGEAARKHRGLPAGSASRRTPDGPRADATDVRWPSLARRGPRHIPVVGPTEALRAPASDTGADVPPAPAPAPSGQEGQSGWQRAQRAWQESGVDWEEPAPARPEEPEDEEPEDEAAQDAPPPLPRRVRLQAFAQSSAFAPSSPFAPSSSFAAAPAFASRPSLAPSPASGATRPLAVPPLSAPVAAAAPPLGESDELFRAWQGSVREAAGRSRWPARWRPARGRAAQGRAAQSMVGRRGLGWQVAKIGVPAAVIVTVGAGALLMLTGRANEMLAERASTGPASSGQSGAVASGQASGKAVPSGHAGAGAAGLTLAGYPGEHGSVGAAALWSAGGTTVAVGYADGHPAVWRHATDGTWSLVSAAALGGLTGHLTSVAQGPSGWIAVGSVSADGTAQPAVLGSPDGVTWTPLPALTSLAGSDAQFVGVAAGSGGYLVVGKQGTGSRERAAFWWSGDLKSWASASGTGKHSHAAAAAAVNGGFIAVGAMANCHTIWLSSDGRHWTEHDLAKPSGATTASLHSVAAGPGGRFVAAGFAAGSAGDIPIVVSSADGGVHVTQTVLSAPHGPAKVTAVTATSSGFVAAGLAGAGKTTRAVEWTSTDGLTWSAATPVNAAGASEITALTDGGSTVTGTVQRGTGPSVVTVPAA